MAQVLVNDSSLSAIADAIREKLDVETTYLPSQMAGAIESIETGGTELTSEDEGKVVVESSGEYVLAAQTSRSISSNGTYDTTTNDEVTVSVQGGASPLTVYKRCDNGRISEGVLRFGIGQSRYDEYQVTAGHIYFVGLGSQTDGVFALATFGSDVSTRRSDGYGSQAYTPNGTVINDITSGAPAYMGVVFKPSSNCYLGVYKSGSGNTSLPTYVFDMSDLIANA